MGETSRGRNWVESGQCTVWQTHSFVLWTLETKCTIPFRFNPAQYPSPLSIRGCLSGMEVPQSWALYLLETLDDSQDSRSGGWPVGYGGHRGRVRIKNMPPTSCLPGSSPPPIHRSHSVLQGKSDQTDSTDSTDLQGLPVKQGQNPCLG